jgi:hypothetical protein
MKMRKPLILLCCFIPAVFLAGVMPDAGAIAFPSSAQATQGDKLVYADFETLQDNRPVSNRGGLVHLFKGQENAGNPCHFKGAGDLDVPELVRLSRDSPNKAATFEYSWPAGNQWANVTLEVNGQADKDGKPVADDVSKYKFLTLQAYVTGVDSLRVEFISRGQGFSIPAGSPQMSFKIGPGFNTYRVPLNAISQPPWVENRINPKDLLKKLTSVDVTVYCNECTPMKGTVVIDNLVFQN